MAKFNFTNRFLGRGEGGHEDAPPDLGEGDPEVDMPRPDENLPEEDDSGKRSGGAGGMRRILILVGIGVILVGGWYLANQLFLSAPPRHPASTRPAAPPVMPKTSAAPAAPAPAAPKAAEPAAPAPEPAPTKAPAPTQAKAVPPPPPIPGVKAKEKAPIKPASKKVAPPPAIPKTEAKVEAKSTPKPKAKPAAKAAPEATAAPAGYSLQIGAMVMEQNAEALRHKLEQSGFATAVRKGTAFVTKHVVTVGEPTGKSEAEALARKLNVDGFPSQLLAAGGKFTPQIGAFFNLDEAIDLARELQKKNFRPKITSKPVTTVVYQVRYGRFDSRSAATKRGEELKAKGFNFMVVRN